MSFEKSFGAVIFRREDGKIYYLLLHYPSSSKAAKDYWDFPKGHPEKGEGETETIKREVEEETGLKDIIFAAGFKEWIKYFFQLEGKRVFKIVTYYLAESKTSEVKISLEHLGFQWLTFEEALGQLSFKNSKEILEKANNFLQNSSYRGQTPIWE